MIDVGKRLVRGRGLLFLGLRFMIRILRTDTFGICEGAVVRTCFYLVRCCK